MKNNQACIDSTAIAALLGISRSTVSKVINGYPNISEATRRKVLDAIAAHGYSPNLGAQLLAGKKSRTLGLFLFIKGQFARDLLINTLIANLIEAAADADYHVLSYVIDDRHNRDTERKVLDVFRQGRVDAGIVVGAHQNDPLIMRLLADGRLLSVFDMPGQLATAQCLKVNFRDQETAYRLIQTLHEHGHRSIALLHGDLDRYGGVERRHGFLCACADLKLAVPSAWQLVANFDQAMAAQLVANWLEKQSILPTAIACANDSMAHGALQALQDRNIRVPEQVSLVGIDGHPLSAMVFPRLTSFKYDFRALAAALVQQAIQALALENATTSETILLPSTFVPGGSLNSLTI